MVSFILFLFCIPNTKSDSIEEELVVPVSEIDKKKVKEDFDRTIMLMRIQLDDSVRIKQLQLIQDCLEQSPELLTPISFRDICSIYVNVEFFEFISEIYDDYTLESFRTEILDTVRGSTNLTWMNDTRIVNKAASTLSISAKDRIVTTRPLLGMYDTFKHNVICSLLNIPKMEVDTTFLFRICVATVNIAGLSISFYAPGSVTIQVGLLPISMTIGIPLADWIAITFLQSDMFKGTRGTTSEDNLFDFFVQNQKDFVVGVSTSVSIDFHWQGVKVGVCMNSDQPNMWSSLSQIFAKSTEESESNIQGMSLALPFHIACSCYTPYDLLTKTTILGAFKIFFIVAQYKIKTEFLTKMDESQKEIMDLCKGLDNTKELFKQECTKILYKIAEEDATDIEAYMPSAYKTLQVFKNLQAFALQSAYKKDLLKQSRVISSKMGIFEYDEEKIRRLIDNIVLQDSNSLYADADKIDFELIYKCCKSPHTKNQFTKNLDLQKSSIATLITYLQTYSRQDPTPTKSEDVQFILHMIEIFNTYELGFTKFKTEQQKQDSTTTYAHFVQIVDKIFHTDQYQSLSTYIQKFQQLRSAATIFHTEYYTSVFSIVTNSPAWNQLQKSSSVEDQQYDAVVTYFNRYIEGIESLLTGLWSPGKADNFKLIIPDRIPAANPTPTNPTPASEEPISSSSAENMDNSPPEENQDSTEKS